MVGPVELPRTREEIKLHNCRMGRYKGECTGMERKVYQDQQVLSLAGTSEQTRVGFRGLYCTPGLSHRARKQSAAPFENRAAAPR